MLFLFPCFILNTFLAAGQSAVDSALKKINASPAPDIHQKISLLNFLASALNEDSTNQALVYANEAYLLSLKQDDPLLKARSLVVLAEGYLYNDKYDQALDFAFNALDLSSAQNSKPDMAESYTMLGWVFFDTENADLSMQYHRKANELFAALGDRKKLSKNLNAIGLIYSMQEKYDSAIVYFNQALKTAEGVNPITAGAALNNLGICYNMIGKYDEALSSFRNSLSVTERTNSHLKMAETMNQMANTYFRQKNYKEALRLLEKARTFIDSSTSNTRKEKLLDNLYLASKVANAVGDYSTAFRDIEEYTNIRNQIISRNKSDAIAAMSLKRERLEKEEQIKVLDEQKKLQIFQRNALAAGVFLICIIGLLLFNRLRQKQRKEKELAEIKQELIKKDLENAVLEKQALNHKLEFKNTELKNSALFIAQRNEMMRQLTTELSGLQEDIKKESLGKFKNLFNRFQHDLEINKEAQEFNLAADEMHKDFLYNLLQKFPNLTETERRLCTQIRLNLSIKDIASFNNISIKSAEMARYRLRKHFNLRHEEGLNEFLGQF